MKNSFAPLGAKRFVLAIQKEIVLYDGDITRARLPSAAWAKIADVALDDFNARIQEHRLKCVKQWTKRMLLDRLLGRELCVLLWACEGSTMLNVVADRWRKLRPEERWWLFQQAAAEGGTDSAEDRDRGWRCAIRAALGDIGRTGQYAFQ